MTVGHPTATDDAREGMRRRELLRTAGIGFGMLAGLAACGDGLDGESRSGASTKGTIAFSHTGRGLDIYPPLIGGAKLEGRQRGYRIVEGFATEDVKQIAEINTWIAQRIDGLTVLALQPDAYAPLVTKAHRADMKVIAYVTQIAGADGRLGIDGKQGGEVVGKAVGEWINANLDGKAKVALVPNIQNPDTVLRVRTAAEVMKQVAPGAEVIREISAQAPTPEEGLEITRNVLQAEPDTSVFIPLNDSLSLGIAKGFTAAGRDPAKVYTTGFDGSKAALEQIIAGKSALKSTGALDLVEFGRLSIRLAANAIEGSGPTTADIEYTVVGQDDLEQARTFLRSYDSA